MAEGSHEGAKPNFPDPVPDVVGDAVTVGVGDAVAMRRRDIVTARVGDAVAVRVKDMVAEGFGDGVEDAVEDDVAEGVGEEVGDAAADLVTEAPGNVVGETAGAGVSDSGAAARRARAGPRLNHLAPALPGSQLINGIGPGVRAASHEPALSTTVWASRPCWRRAKLDMDQ